MGPGMWTSRACSPALFLILISLHREATVASSLLQGCNGDALPRDAAPVSRPLPERLKLRNSRNMFLEDPDAITSATHQDQTEVTAEALAFVPASFSGQFLKLIGHSRGAPSTRASRRGGGDSRPGDTEGSSGVQGKIFQGMAAFLFFGTIHALIPSAPSTKKSFFDGWFVRIIDHEKDLSCGLIMGSLRLPGSDAFDQHYLCISYARGQQERLVSVHALLGRDKVSVLKDGEELSGFKDETDWKAPSCAKCAEFSWRSRKHGAFEVKNYGRKINLHFAIPDESGGKVTLEASLTRPKRWGASHEDGPEGWTGRTPLLPCHYHVQSLGSEADYRLEWVPPPPAAAPPSPPQAGAGPSGQPAAFSFWQAPWSADPAAGSQGGGGLAATPKGGGAAEEGEESRGGEARRWREAGRGSAHVETNYGESFPSGWIYIQAISAGNEVSLVLTGGRFGIGPFTPNVWIIAVRGPGVECDFRTIDLHQINARFSCKERRFTLTAINPFTRDRLELDVSDRMQRQDAHNVWVPTTHGFSRDPGCSESFEATARIRLWQAHLKRRRAPDLDVEVPRCALEFGGTFQAEQADFGLKPSAGTHMYDGYMS